MANIKCLICTWEGEEEQLVEIFIPNENNVDDHCLYPVKACPFCEDENNLVYDTPTIVEPIS